MLVKQETELPNKKRMELSEIDTETGTKLSDGILEDNSDGIEAEFEFPGSPGNTPNQIIQGMQGAEMDLDPEPKKTVNKYLQEMEPVEFLI